jgi:hypothetical protein
VIRPDLLVPLALTVADALGYGLPMTGVEGIAILVWGVVHPPVEGVLRQVTERLLVGDVVARADAV